VINYVSDLRQVNGFLRVLQFSPPIKLTDIFLKGQAFNLMRDGINWKKGGKYFADK
jgi:hypothetical protein